MSPDASSNFPSEQCPPLATRSSMILGLKEFSRERWHDFVLVYSPLIRFWIRQKSMNQESEDDILQECLRAIFTGIPQFEKGSTFGTFRGWLRVIVQRRVADHFRQASMERPAPQAYFNLLATPSQKDPEELQAEQDALLALEARAMELVRKTTSEKTWQMFWLNTVENVPTKTIASQFQVTQAAVRVARGRVLQRLRDILMEDIETEP